MADALGILERHLHDKTYLVSDTQITLADIVLVTTLLYPLKLVADPAYLRPFPAVVRWFTTCVQQDAFQQVIGQTTLCQKELKPQGA